MTAINYYQSKGDPKKRPGPGQLGIWRRMFAEDSLLSPFRVLLMLAIIVLLIAAVWVAVAY